MEIINCLTEMVNGNDETMNIAESHTGDGAGTLAHNTKTNTTAAIILTKSKNSSKRRVATQRHHNKQKHNKQKRNKQKRKAQATTMSAPKETTWRLRLTKIAMLAILIFTAAPPLGIQKLSPKSKPQSNDATRGVRDQSVTGQPRRWLTDYAVK